MLGALPTQDTLILERFFDESGGMQLVLHAPFGSRVNRAWGLALRKRFCRQFNFELQAAATEDAVLLSLGPQHSFPLESVFRYLHPDTVRDVLVQALLDAPMFGDPLAVECLDRPGPAAEPRRTQGAAADPADGGGGPARRRLPGRRRVPGEHPGRSRGPRSPAGAADGRRLPARGDGPRRIDRRAPPDPRGRDPVHRPRSAGAVAAGARDPQREALRVPRRRSAGGAPRPGGVHPPRLRALLRGRPRRARSRGHRAGARGGLAGGPGRGRAARRLADLRVSDRGRGLPLGRVHERAGRGRACGASRGPSGSPRSVGRSVASCPTCASSYEDVSASSARPPRPRSRRPSACRRARWRRRSSRWRPREWCSAGASVPAMPRPRPSWSGASADCWRGSIATRSTASARRSSR